MPFPQCSALRTTRPPCDPNEARTNPQRHLTHLICLARIVLRFMAPGPTMSGTTEIAAPRGVTFVDSVSAEFF